MFVASPGTQPSSIGKAIRWVYNDLNACNLVIVLSVAEQGIFRTTIEHLEHEGYIGPMGSLWTSSDNDMVLCSKNVVDRAHNRLQRR